MTRQFNTAPAQRAQVNLIIGLVGPSSSGKTYTALEMATGIQSVTGGDIEMIDTEHERGLFYADKFKFNHTSFGAPFASLDYLAAIQQAATRSKIIIVDSMSHEHESEGGMVDYQEQELTRMAGTDYGKRERMQMLAWAKPKAARRKLLQGLTQVDAHIILCFRAKNTSKPGKNDQGRNVVIPMGFVPIAGEEFVFESALSILFHPNARGVPTWHPEMPGERIAVKIPGQFDWLAQKEGPITRQDGARLAEWARGGSPTPKPKTTVQPPSEPLDAPIGDEDMSALNDWYDLTDHDIDECADTEAAAKFNAILKTPEWSQLREADPARAQALREKATGKAKRAKAQETEGV